MGAALFASYANKTRIVAADGDLRVAAEVAEATITQNAVSVQLKLRIRTLQQTLPLLQVRIMTMVDIMDASLVEGPMVGAVLDSCLGPLVTFFLLALPTLIHKFKRRKKRPPRR